MPSPTPQDAGLPVVSAQPTPPDPLSLTTTRSRRNTQLTWRRRRSAHSFKSLLGALGLIVVIGVASAFYWKWQDLQGELLSAQRARDRAQVRAGKAETQAMQASADSIRARKQVRQARSQSARVRCVDGRGQPASGEP